MPGEKKSQKTVGWLHVPAGLSTMDSPRRAELRPTSLPLVGILDPCTVRAISEFSSTHPWLIHHFLHPSLTFWLFERQARRDTVLLSEKNVSGVCCHLVKEVRLSLLQKPEGSCVLPRSWLQESSTHEVGPCGDGQVCVPRAQVIAQNR